jgi:hypothetical protein
MRNERRDGGEAKERGGAVPKAERGVQQRGEEMRQLSGYRQIRCREVDVTELREE